MNSIRSKVLVLFSTSLLFGCASATAEKTKDDTVTLEPYAHKFYWESFVLSKDLPVSPDGCYRLKEVLPGDAVELIFSPSPVESKVIVVRPMPKSFKQGEPHPTVVVVESNPKAQSATIKELRMK